MTTTSLRLLLLASLAASSASAQNWPHLRLHFPRVPGLDEGYRPHPLTAAEADAAGWELIGECGDGRGFEGFRYVEDPFDSDKDDAVLIYDVNGYLAGVQSVVPEENTFEDFYFPFSTNPYYVLDVHPSGVGSAYYNTAYFVPVDIICTSGRTQEQFEEEGAGSVVLLQSGPDAGIVTEMPLTDAGMKDGGGPGGIWYEHYCVNGMGKHWITFDYKETQPCEEFVPWQILYDMDGNLNGVIAQHVAIDSGDLFEPITTFGLTSIVDTPPQCIRDAVFAPGLSSIHMWLGDYEIDCTGCTNCHDKE